MTENSALREKKFQTWNFPPPNKIQSYEVFPHFCCPYQLCQNRQMDPTHIRGYYFQFMGDLHKKRWNKLIEFRLSKTNYMIGVVEPPLRTTADSRLRMDLDLLQGDMPTVLCLLHTLPDKQQKQQQHHPDQEQQQHPSQEQQQHENNNKQLRYEHSLPPPPQ